jgi:lipoprotein-releasing system permease protein
VVPFIALRYLTAGRRERGLATSLLSIVGVAVGVMALTVVLGVMNGFQLGFIEPIVELSSYHIRVEGPPVGDSRLADGPFAALRAIPSVTAVIPFQEQRGLMVGTTGKTLPCTVRCVPPDMLTIDPSQARMLDFQSGSFDLGSEDSIVLGSVLASNAGAGVGSVIALVTIGGDGVLPKAQRRTFTVTGIFRSGYLDLDAGLAFVPEGAASLLAGPGGLPVTYGVKIADRFQDQDVLQEVARTVSGTGFRAESWRVYNRSFFDALFMEKLMMMILVGLIFIVVGFNIYNSLRRTVFEKKEEIAVLKAIGVPPRSIQYAFIFEGMTIGVVGAFAGLLLGLALAVNINGVFSIVEDLINFAIRAARTLFASFHPGIGSFSIFSPMYFYLTEVTAKVLFPETILVAFFALMACVGAAWGASRTVSSFRPSEILRYE